MKQYIINSEEAIKRFLFDIHKRYKQPFLPEDDFKDFLDEKGQPVFSDEEAAYLDDVMLYCFVFCLDNALDLHDIAEEVQAGYFALEKKFQERMKEITSQQKKFFI